MATDSAPAAAPAPADQPRHERKPKPKPEPNNMRRGRPIYRITEDTLAGAHWDVLLTSYEDDSHEIHVVEGHDPLNAYLITLPAGTIGSDCLVKSLSKRQISWDVDRRALTIVHNGACMNTDTTEDAKLIYLAEKVSENEALATAARIQRTRYSFLYMEHAKMNIMRVFSESTGRAGLSINLGSFN